MRTSKRGAALAYAALSVLAVLFLLPFYVIVRNAFSTQAWITAPTWHWLPNVSDLRNAEAIWRDESVQLGQALLNSAIVSVLQTAGTVAISMMAGYALARRSDRAARTILGLTVFTLMVPTTVTFVPMFVMASSLGWISTYRGLIVPALFSAFATYLFRSAFADFPRELEESASLDGANVATTFWRVVVPNSLGIVAAVGTITFIGSWNSFLWPMLIAQDPAMRTVQLTLSQFMTSQGIEYPAIFTGALVALVPTLFVFLFLQRWLVRGVTQSGLK